MRSGPELDFATVSDPGRRRRNNEDSSLIDPLSGLVLVADGMGGYKAGEVASAIAAKVVLDDVRASRKPEPPPDGVAESREAGLLRTAIQSANRHIFDAAQEVREYRGMGTTIVAALFTGDRVTIAHVGDSRLYRLRGTALERITNDHSLIQEMIDKGFLSAEQAEATTPRNLVTRALGIEAEVRVDLRELPTAPEDIYLLCSDGLTDMVTDEDIRLTLTEYGANLQKAAEELVERANAAGGRDNVSVVLARPVGAGPGNQGVGTRLRNLWPRGTR